MATTTATTDTEAALAAGVATPPESLEEYKELVAAETAKPIYQNIGDYGDADRGWTVQSGWTPPVPSDVPTEPGMETQLAVEQAVPWGMAVAADTVFWVNGDGQGNDQPLRVMSVPTDGMQSPTELAQEQTSPWGVAADETYVYWTDYTEVKALPHAGGEPLLLADQQNIGRSIVVDDDQVYWITRTRVLQRPKP